MTLSPKNGSSKEPTSSVMTSARHGPLRSASLRMLSAKCRSPPLAVAKHSFARGAMSWTICSIARPSSAPCVLSSTTLTSFGRSPVATSCAAWIVSGLPLTSVVASSNESDSAPTVMPLPSTPRGTRSTRWAWTPCDVAAPTFVNAFGAWATEATPSVVASVFTWLRAMKPSSACWSVDWVWTCRPAASARWRTVASDSPGRAYTSTSTRPALSRIASRPWSAWNPPAVGAGGCTRRLGPLPGRGGGEAGGSSERPAPASVSDPMVASAAEAATRALRLLMVSSLARRCTAGFRANAYVPETHPMNEMAVSRQRTVFARDRRSASDAERERAADVRPALDDAEARVEGGPALEDRAVQPQRRHDRRAQRAELGPDEADVGLSGGGRDLARGRLRAGEHRADAVADRRDDAVDHRAPALERAPRGDEHDLRVRGGAVVLHAKLADGHAAPPQRDALRVPERRHGVDALGQDARHRLEADRHLLDPGVVAAVALDDRADERGVRRQPRHPHRAAREVAGAAHVRLGDQRGERPLHERGDPDDIDPALARDRQVVDVEDADVDAARGQQRERVRRRPRLADAQPDAVAAVEALPDGGVDGRVHGVRREVERERGGRRRPRRRRGGAL